MLGTVPTPGSTGSTTDEGFVTQGSTNFPSAELPADAKLWQQLTTVSLPHIMTNESTADPAGTLGVKSPVAEQELSKYCTGRAPPMEMWWDVLLM